MKINLVPYKKSQDSDRRPVRNSGVSRYGVMRHDPPIPRLSKVVAGGYLIPVREDKQPRRQVHDKESGHGDL